MLEMTDQDAFISRRCFYCKPLKATITRQQCELNRKLPRLNENIEQDRWNTLKGSAVGRAVAAGIRRPFQCESCKGPDDQGKEEIMSKLGTCQECGKDNKDLIGGRCRTCYDRERNRKYREKKAAGADITKALDGATEKFRRKAVQPEAPKAAPDKPEPKLPRPAPPVIVPSNGKLYLLAEIRIMTEAEIRRMFGG